MKNIKLYFFLYAIVFSSCAPKVQQEVDYGVFNENIYINKQLGISLVVPADYSFTNTNELKAMSKENIEELTKGTQNESYKNKRIQQLSTLIFAIFKYPGYYYGGKSEYYNDCNKYKLQPSTEKYRK